MEFRSDTSTTTQLRQRARERGLDLTVTQKQLERWRYERVIPSPDTVPRGQREGVGRTYSEAQLDYIIEFARYSTGRPRFRPAGMFLSGREVPIECLRASYAHVFETIDAGLERHGSLSATDDLAYEIAAAIRSSRDPDSIRHRTHRRILFRAHRNVDAIGGYVEAHSFEDFDYSIAFNTVISHLAPDDLTDDGVEHLLIEASAAVPALADPHGERTTNERDQFRSLLTNLDGAALRRAAAQTPYSHLQDVRDDLRALGVLDDEAPYLSPQPTVIFLAVAQVWPYLRPALETAGKLSLRGENPS